MPEARLRVISAIVSQLRSTDLRPGPVVDGLFRDLVAAAVTGPADHPLLSRPSVVAEIRDLCARGEAYLEAHWARLVAANPWMLRSFPYLANYVRLARGEYAALVEALGRVPRRLVFAGSGPLPLSALMLERLAPGVVVTCVDCDADAVRRGREVACALTGGRSRARFICADAATFDYSGCDVAVVAALVGVEPEAKASVLSGVACSLPGDALLAARSVPADGRRLLYPRIESAHIPSGLHTLREWTPPPGVINSLLLLLPSS